MTKKELEELEKVDGGAQYSASDLTRGFAPWSISRAKVGAKCALQFIWQYIEKLPSDVTLNKDDSATRIGSAMHEIYEIMLTSEWHNHDVYKKTLDSAYELVIRKYKITSTERDIMQELFDNVEWFMSAARDVLTSRVAPSSYRVGELLRDGLLGIEKKFGLDADLNNSHDFFNNSGTTFLRGVIDFMVKTHDGGALVIDHKSSRYASNKYHEEQLRAYAIAAFALYPEIKWVQCGIHFMPLREVKWNPIIFRSNLNGEKRALHSFLTGAANNILEGDLSIGSHCKWCVYKERCKALRKERRKAKKQNKTGL